MELTPELILAMWVGGIAAGSAVVTGWRVVGPGYVWLNGALVAGLGVVVAVAGGGPAALMAAASGMLAVVLARRSDLAMVALGAAAGLLLVVAAADSPIVLALTGLGLLGAVTSEMVLGHWFLTDPKLPRRPLFALGAAGGGFLVADVLVTMVAERPDPVDSVLLATYLVLALFTALLVAGVWFSLREPRYSGVMSATGLSYLAVLCTFGVVTIGRALVTGGLS